jgi:hypothetical protein
MSRAVSGDRWLRLYPKAWRERYGEELRELITVTSGPGPLPWRTRADLIAAGMRERMRSIGLGGPGTPPQRRVRAGLLLVLCAWAVMLIGGGVLQRFSENWREVAPAADQGLAGGAYDALRVAAALAGAFVLTGILIALPHFLVLLRRGGWSEMRGPTLRALEVSALAVVATLAIMIWSRHLNAAQRNGHDLAYVLGFLIWGAVGVTCLACWAVVAVRAAWRMELSPKWMRIETTIALAAALCMASATVASAVWWGALARSAPWALGDMPAGSAGAVITAPLLLAGALMAIGAALALAGATWALRARSALD